MALSPADNPAADVFAAMSRAPNARLGARLDLGEGRAVALWHNHAARVRYAGSGYHTVSLYLSGGDGVRRVDHGAAAAQGRPGAICIMPQGAASDWDVAGDLGLVHLYLPDAALRAHAAAELDRDPSALSVPELTFGDDPVIAGLMARLAAVTAGAGAKVGAGAEAAALLTGQSLAAAVQQRLLTTLAGRPAVRFRGGLAPSRARHLRAYIEANIDAPLSLGALAAEAGISPWHFHRAFSATFGVSPHDWVMGRRIARAAAMLATGSPPATVAAACGFSSQSHLTRAFARARRLTPARYARACARLALALPAPRP